MRRTDWAGLAIVIMALGLALGWAGTLLVISGPWDPDPLSDAGANLLSTVGGLMGGAVAAYIGMGHLRASPRRYDSEPRQRPVAKHERRDEPGPWKPTEV